MSEANTKPGREHMKEIVGHLHKAAHYGGHGFMVGDQQESSRTNANQASDGTQPDGGETPLEGPADYGKLGY